MAGLNSKLAGRWAVVTGGHVRVGHAISLALVQLRMNIIVTYRTSPDAAEKAVAEFQALGVQAHAFAVDMADAAAVVCVADDMAALAGSSLAVLVNSASIYKATPLGEISAAQWDDLMAINLRAPFLLSQRLGLAIKAAGGGHIVNIGDWAAMHPYRGYLPYLISKAGIVQMTRALALELAPEVQVNCVCPGAVLPPENTTPAEAAELEAATPLHRLGSPEEIAHAVRYFVESDFATGAILTVDGGRLIA
jgi:pteridine reductase